MSDTRASTTQVFKPVLSPPWPTKRREQVQWCRFLVGSEPKISAAFDFALHAVLDSAGTMNVRDRHHSRDIMEATFVPLGGEQRRTLGAVVKELLTIGYVFSDRFGATLNPDWHDEVSEKVFQLPDEDLKKVVWTKQPKAIYDRIPQHTRQMVMNGSPFEVPGAKLIKMPQNEQSALNEQSILENGMAPPAPGTPGSMVKALDEAIRVAKMPFCPEDVVGMVHEYCLDARSALCDWADSFQKGGLLGWQDPYIQRMPASLLRG